MMFIEMSTKQINCKDRKGLSCLLFKNVVNIPQLFKKEIHKTQSNHFPRGILGFLQPIYVRQKQNSTTDTL